MNIASFLSATIASKIRRLHPARAERRNALALQDQSQQQLPSDPPPDGTPCAALMDTIPLRFSNASFSGGRRTCEEADTLMLIMERRLQAISRSNADTTTSAFDPRAPKRKHHPSNNQSASFTVDLNSQVTWMPDDSVLRPIDEVRILQEMVAFPPGPPAPSPDADPSNGISYIELLSPMYVRADIMLFKAEMVIAAKNNDPETRDAKRKRTRLSFPPPTAEDGADAGDEGLTVLYRRPCCVKLRIVSQAAEDEANTMRQIYETPIAGSVVPRIHAFFRLTLPDTSDLEIDAVRGGDGDETDASTPPTPLSPGGGQNSKNNNASVSIPGSYSLYGICMDWIPYTANALLFPGNNAFAQKECKRLQQRFKTAVVAHALPEPPPTIAPSYTGGCIYRCTAGIPIRFAPTASPQNPVDMPTAVTAACLQALQRMHRAGWVHGDTHLGNFLIDASTWRVYIIDFERSFPCNIPQQHLLDVQELFGHASSVLVSYPYEHSWNMREVLPVLTQLHPAFPNSRHYAALPPEARNSIATSPVFEANTRSEQRRRLFHLLPVCTCFVQPEREDRLAGCSMCNSNFNRINANYYYHSYSVYRDNNYERFAYHRPQEDGAPGAVEEEDDLDRMAFRQHAELRTFFSDFQPPHPAAQKSSTSNAAAEGDRKGDRQRYHTKNLLLPTVLAPHLPATFPPHYYRHVPPEEEEEYAHDLRHHYRPSIATPSPSLRLPAVTQASTTLTFFRSLAPPDGALDGDYQEDDDTTDECARRLFEVTHCLGSTIASSTESIATRRLVQRPSTLPPAACQEKDHLDRFVQALFDVSLPRIHALVNETRTKMRLAYIPAANELVELMPLLVHLVDFGSDIDLKSKKGRVLFDDWFHETIFGSAVINRSEENAFVSRHLVQCMHELGCHDVAKRLLDLIPPRYYFNNFTPAGVPFAFATHQAPPTATAGTISVATSLSASSGVC